MNLPLFLAAVPAEAGHGEAPAGGPAALLNAFGVTWPSLIAQVAVFTVLFLVLWKFAYAPILKLLDERKLKIAQGLEDADKAKQTLADADKLREEVIAKASAQATQIVSEAQKAAAALTEKRNQESIAQAEEIIRKAREATQLDYDRMLGELKREVGKLVVATTEKVVGRELTPADQTRLADEASRQIAA
jgi:F-type H+-transporting ATPase subunit b